MQAENKSVYRCGFTCFEEVEDGVLSDSRHLAGAEEHAELIHVEGHFSRFMNG